MALREIDIPIIVKPESICVRAGVLAEVSELSALGLDVALTDTADIYRPDLERQAFIDSKVAELEASANGAQQFRSHEGIAGWAPLTKRAIALHTLYNPNAKTIGEGIDPRAYTYPIFDGKSAEDLMYEEMPQKAQRWIDAYKAFLPTAIDRPYASDQISSYDYFSGVADSRAIRTRATAAMEMAEAHIMSTHSLSERQDLISASLACGAAGPVYNLVKGLGEHGHNFSEVILVDQDVMALATAASLAESSGVADKVKIERRNLLTENLMDYIKPHSVDVVDLLGLFEYIPNNERSGKWGSALLNKVREIVKPGGMIVFGNMLNERPQQAFFSNVVKWPRLHQRSIGEVLDIIEEAGFPACNTTVRVPSEGVYAVYVIKIPEVIALHDDSQSSVAKDLGLAALENY